MISVVEVKFAEYENSRSSWTFFLLSFIIVLLSYEFAVIYSDCHRVIAVSFTFMLLSKSYQSHRAQSLIKRMFLLVHVFVVIIDE